MNKEHHHHHHWNDRHDSELIFGKKQDTNDHDHHHSHDDNHNHCHEDVDKLDLTGWNAHMRTHLRLNQPLCRSDFHNLLKCKNPNCKCLNPRKPWIPVYI